MVSTSAYRAGGDGFESHLGQFSYNSLMVMSQAYDVNSNDIYSSPPLMFHPIYIWLTKDIPKPVPFCKIEDRVIHIKKVKLMTLQSVQYIYIYIYIIIYYYILLYIYYIYYIIILLLYLSFLNPEYSFKNKYSFLKI